jgi:hypothetical protein
MSETPIGGVKIVLDQGHTKDPTVASEAALAGPFHSEGSDDFDQG